MGNLGNLKKHTTKNPLKRKMIENFNNKFIQIISDEFFNNIDKKQSVNVLDMGCGEGFITRLLYKNYKYWNINIDALDYSLEAIEYAKTNTNEFVLGGGRDFSNINDVIHYDKGDIRNINKSDRYFDIVISSEVIEHIENPSAALKELLRVTKDTLVISVPWEPFFCMGNMLVLKNVTRLGNPIDHINHWTEKTFKNFIVNNGLKDFNIYKSFPWLIAVIKVKNK